MTNGRLRRSQSSDRSQQPNRLAISPDKRFLAVAGVGTVKLYDIAASAAASSGNIAPVRRACPFFLCDHLDSQVEASRSVNEELTLNLPLLLQLVTLTGHTANITSLAWHAEAKWLVSGSEDGTVKIWDVRCVEDLTLQPRALAIQRPA